MDLLRIVACGVIGYGIGSISSGYIVGRLYRNVDLRTVGSGSTGATNTFRTLGLGAALLVAILDILKGAGAVWIASAIVDGSSDERSVAAAVAAVAAVAGHCWPAFLEGRGGRGVATGFGALLFIATPAWLGAVVAFMLALALTRMVSVSSLASVAGALLGYIVFVFAGYLSFHWAVLGFIIIAGAIVTLRHRANIARIVRGNEPRLGQRRSPST
ncbi:MAG TPA: glycerol-3-phosphate 1-O-acyltransferase PlsY [Patescibacteria group bacterium]|jgi:glycerol-3-phosphate acyltransferase PlsY|nr:glycerol-3-phosphate 1-O-acyltransferase PlsY [Patescibacteria group bacterium]